MHLLMTSGAVAFVLRIHAIGSASKKAFEGTLRVFHIHPFAGHHAFFLFLKIETLGFSKKLLDVNGIRKTVLERHYQ